MPRASFHSGVGRGATAVRRRLLPAVAALALAAGTLTGCSTDAADITAPTEQRVLVRRYGGTSSASQGSTTQGAPDGTSATSSKPGRSGFLLSTGRE
jgi:hypothetical protein